ncbi:hypothetical protein [Nonomuraea typhae]|uniref:Uncharacterized protein n=1 Tax=Nonomuraea typhae TaxID=2603600 RepID=A0ABW7YLF0_9ACTN
MERRIIAALAAVNVRAQRAQLPYRNANIYAELGNDAMLQVDAYPTDIRLSATRAGDVRRIRGVVVRKMKYSITDDGFDQFTCRKTNYAVRGEIPSRYKNMDAFLARLIPLLCCPTRHSRAAR